MGMGSFLARRGNVGGTARAVATYYHSVLGGIKNPQDIKDDKQLRNQLFSTIVLSRYDNFPLNKAKAPIFADIVIKNISEGGITTLPELSWFMLAIETNAQVDLKTIEEWMGIMKEELLKKGVPEYLC